MLSSTSNKAHSLKSLPGKYLCYEEQYFQAYECRSVRSLCNQHNRQGQVGRLTGIWQCTQFCKLPCIGFIKTLPGLLKFYSANL